MVEPYALLRPESSQSTIELLNESLSPNFSILNFPRIQMPSGGSLAFRVQTLAGEQPEKELEGILTAFRSARLFWRGNFSGGHKPPDCTSKDGLVGIGDPGGRCADCHYAQFGTAVLPNGNPGAGQACKDIRQLLLLRPGEILPHLLSVPPTSLKAFTQYNMQLLSAQIPYWATITRLTLEKANNEGGIAYARLVLSLSRRLGEKEVRALKPYHQKMKELLTPAMIDATDYTAEETTR
jgi:hypothetical protein